LALTWTASITSTPSSLATAAARDAAALRQLLAESQQASARDTASLRQQLEDSQQKLLAATVLASVSQVRPLLNARLTG